MTVPPIQSLTESHLDDRLRIKDKILLWLAIQRMNKKNVADPLRFAKFSNTNFAGSAPSLIKSTNVTLAKVEGKKD